MHSLACLRLNTAGTGTQLTREYPRLTTIQISGLSSPIGEKQSSTTRGTSCVGERGCHIGSSLFTSSCLKPRDDLNHSTGAVNLQYLCRIRLKYCSVGTMGNSDVVHVCAVHILFINYYFVNAAVFKSSTASCFMHFSGLPPLPSPFLLWSDTSCFCSREQHKNMSRVMWLSAGRLSMQTDRKRKAARESRKRGLI